MFMRETPLGGFLAAPKYFARNYVRVAREAEVAERVAHDLLGFARLVALGIVEKIHAGLIGRAEHFRGGAGVDLLAESDPRAERKQTHLQTRFAEATVFHYCSPDSLIILGEGKGQCGKILGSLVGNKNGQCGSAQ